MADVAISATAGHIGDRVRWHRDLGHRNAEVTIAERAYRVRIADPMSG
jgi:hypothetical protein